MLRGELSYTDPQTGLQAFTRLYLLKRPCCGRGGPCHQFLELSPRLTRWQHHRMRRPAM
ncbi:TPA: hypothetical protein HA295_01440 [Candidatus Woesearchaeota archaeon]|nr:hypothetical protein [Candidatus Woesearchaeota archaeon]